MVRQHNRKLWKTKTKSLEAFVNAIKAIGENVLRLHLWYYMVHQNLISQLIYCLRKELSERKSCLGWEVFRGNMCMEELWRGDIQVGIVWELVSIYSYSESGTLACAWTYENGFVLTFVDFNNYSKFCTPTCDKAMPITVVTIWGNTPTLILTTLH